MELRQFADNCAQRHSTPIFLVINGTRLCHNFSRHFIAILYQFRALKELNRWTKNIVMDGDARGESDNKVLLDNIVRLHANCQTHHWWTWITFHVSDCNRVHYGWSLNIAFRDDHKAVKYASNDGFGNLAGFAKTFWPNFRYFWDFTQTVRKR